MTPAIMLQTDGHPFEEAAVCPMCGAAVSPQDETCRECGETLPRPKKPAPPAKSSGGLVLVLVILIGFVGGWFLAFRIMRLFIQPTPSNDWKFDVAGAAGGGVSALLGWVLVRRFDLHKNLAVQVVAGFFFLLLFLSSCLF